MIGVLPLLFLFASRTLAGMGEWMKYTDIKSVVGIAVKGTTLWASTRGGLFRLNLPDTSFVTFTNSEGLTNNNLTAIAIDDEGKIWIGTSSGAIDIYDSETGQWKRIRDIVLSDRTKKGITGIYPRRDSIYISAEFGVSLFLRDRFEFRETYSKFGSFPSSIRVNSFLIADGKLWAATPSGLAFADANSTNLASPTSWSTHTVATGLPSNNVNAVLAFDGSIYAATDGGLVRLISSRWERIAALSGRRVSQLAQLANQLYAVVDREVYSITANGTVSSVGPSLPGAVNVVSSDPSGNLLVGVENNGVGFLKGSSWSLKFPDGPGSNLFISVKVDTAGVLWSATGTNGRGTGFSSFDPTAGSGPQWKNYNTRSNPELRTNDYYKVSIGIGNSKWVSSWGEGVARVARSGSLTVFGRENAGLVGIPENPNFIVIGDVVADRRGNTWMTVRSAANGNVLAVFRPDSTWFFLRNGYNPNVTLLTSLAIDPFDTKWVVSQDPLRPGLLYLNDGGTLTNFNDDVWNILTTTDGLSSDNITDLLVDEDGQVWVGTDLGLNIILNPRSPKGNVRRVFIAREQYVNDIAVDPLGNKWVATKEGVFVLSTDGTRLLNQYSVSNTEGKLIGDDVRAIAFDDRRGIVYFGTENGLSSLTTTAMAPLETFVELSLYPNPFRPPRDQLLNIDGLVRNSGIKILSIDGRLVREFASPGGRIAFWDGRDAAGTFVSSGIYVVVAISENGEEVTRGKVAVVRE